MAYKPIHNYRQRDKLPPNDPNKIIYGSHLSDDFEEIAKFLGAIESHIDSIGVAPETDLSGFVEEAPEDGVIYGRSNKNWIPVQAGGGGSIRDGVQNIDGGNASSIYLLDQVIDGGSA